MSGLPLIILCCCIVGCSAFSSGAAYSACTSRTPGHGAAVQTTACPFEVAGLSWTPGEYTIMGVYPRYGNAGSTFRGFLVSAYDKTTGAPVGEMRQTAQTNAASWPQNPPLMRTCGDTSLTHTSRLPKEEVYFEWRAPADYDKDVVELRLTVVQEYFTYWVDCNPVDLVRTGGVRPQPTTTTTTAAPITTTTNPTTTTIAKRLITAQADAVRSTNRNCPC